MSPTALPIDDCWNRIGVQGDHSCPELERHVHCRNCPVHARAARTLLDRAPPVDYLADWTRHVARAPVVEEADTLSVLIFRIGAEWLALPTSVLEEVAEQRPIHSLPHRRNRLVRGVVNVRGELLVCVALGELLGTDSAGPSVRKGTGVVHERLLVVSREGSRLACPADEVHGVERFPRAAVRAVPATVGQAPRAYTTGVLQWRDRAVGHLDDERLFSALNRSLA